MDVLEDFREQSLAHLCQVVEPFEKLSMLVIQEDVAESVRLLVASVQALIDEADATLSLDDDGASPESIAKKPRI